MDPVRHGDNGWLYPANEPEFPVPPCAGPWRPAPAVVERRTSETLGDELLGHYQSLVDQAARAPASRAERLTMARWLPVPDPASYEDDDSLERAAIVA